MTALPSETLTGAIIHPGAPDEGDYWLMTEERPLYGRWNRREASFDTEDHPPSVGGRSRYFTTSAGTCAHRAVLAHCDGSLSLAEAWRAWCAWAPEALGYSAEDVAFYLNHHGNTRVLESAA